MDNDIEKIRDFIQNKNKKEFPYLSGIKICNYWLYVIYQYTGRKYKNIHKITVAPDTHVCKATLKLGVITEEGCFKHCSGLKTKLVSLSIYVFSADSHKV